MERMPKEKNQNNSSNLRSDTHVQFGQNSKQAGIAASMDNCTRLVAQRIKLQSFFGRIAQLKGIEANLMRNKVTDGPRQGMKKPIQASIQFVIQRAVVPYTKKDLGLEDPATTFADETIGFVKYDRTSSMTYTKTDGDNTGSIKHHVPWNWIAVNLKFLIENKKRKEVYNTLDPIRTYLGVAKPPFNPTENRISFDSWVESVFEGICNWEENLFKHSVSTGDGKGEKLDYPKNSPDVEYRVDVARKKLEYVGLGNKPMSK